MNKNYVSEPTLREIYEYEITSRVVVKENIGGARGLVYVTVKGTGAKIYLSVDDFAWSTIGLAVENGLYLDASQRLWRRTNNGWQDVIPTYAATLAVPMPKFPIRRLQEGKEIYE